ncbi:MAG: hypothetical protein HYS09_00155 [Chloroflexi bacterium]|nr:hypothetical protein [Chloroflexota bacterium]
MIVPGGAALRPAVLDAVRAKGAEIRGLIAEEGRLDALYRELVEGAPPADAHGEEQKVEGMAVTLGVKRAG